MTPPYTSSARPWFACLLLLGGAACDDGPKYAGAELDGVTPALLCAPDATTLVIRGEALLPDVHDETEGDAVRVPRVRLRRTSDALGGPLAPVELRRDDARWLQDASLALDVGPELVPGTWEVAVGLPGGGWAALPDALVVLDVPRVEAPSPDSVCADAPAADVILTGTGLYVGPDGGPEVTVAGASAVAEARRCGPIVGGRGALCTELGVALAPSEHALGTADIEVRNRPPVACAAPVPARVRIRPPPEPLGVAPGRVCGAGRTVEVEGRELDMVTEAWIGEVRADIVASSLTTLTLRVGEGTPAGVWPVRLATPDACEAELTDVVEVSGPPAVLWIDPGAVLARLGGELQLLASGLDGAVASVVAVGPAGEAIPLSFVDREDGTLTASAPAGLEAGTWTVAVTTDSGCAGDSTASFEVVEEATLPLDSVTPGFAWTWDYTSVAISLVDPLPAGEGGFVGSPRVTLSSREGAGARVLQAVRVRDAGTLVAVIPPRVPVGAWDLVVTNGDGALGVLERAIVVTEAPPPVVDAAAPASLSTSSDTRLTLEGRHFRDPTVRMRCDDGQVVTAVVESARSSRVVATVPSMGMVPAVCIVELTNADGTAFTYAALSIRNPAQNLFGWQRGTELVEARRAPAAVAARATASSRYVWAIGGDDGSTGGAKVSIERAPIGVFGDLGDWRLTEASLPAPRTRAMVARVGSFVYLVGGHDGASAVDTTWRARILDPLDVPHHESLALTRGALPEGAYTWTVAAVMAPDDPGNPDGEGLPGDGVSARIPDGAGVAFSWTEVDGAVTYRVYRTDPDGVSGLVAEVVDTSFLDDGAPLDPSALPKAEGALGAWVAVATLNVARDGGCLAVVREQDTDPERAYLYAFGGLDPRGAALDTIERLDVDVEDARIQDVGVWRLLPERLSTARALCAAVAVQADQHPAIPEGERWIYVLGGTDGRRATGAVDVGQVGALGAFDSWASLGSLSPARAGHGWAAASDTLYVFGGQQGSASTGGASGTIAQVPQIRNWNSLGTSYSEARLLPGSAQESAVILAIGGATDALAATRSTDWTQN